MISHFDGFLIIANSYMEKKKLWLQWQMGMIHVFVGS